MGPSSENRQGEKITNNVAMTTTRRGRKLVRARVIGIHSAPWGEMCSLWGAKVECIVKLGGNSLSHCYNYLNLQQCSYDAALQLQLPPKRNFNGVVFATIRNDEESRQVLKLILAWKPSICILSLPMDWIRSKVLADFGHQSTPFYMICFSICHQEVGGVTSGRWKICYLSRFSMPKKAELYTHSSYLPTLQRALDDTVGPAKLPAGWSYEPGTNRCVTSANITGVIYDGDGSKKLPVYHSLAPDISGLPEFDRKFWLEANSVWSKERVLRKVTLPELFAIWDYEGKLETKSMDIDEAFTLLEQRLLCPPGKILRSLGHVALHSLLPDSMSSMTSAETSTVNDRGLTSDIPVGPLEQQVETRVEAKLADDAPVDYSLWALPGETPEEESARHVLRRLAVKWWADHLEREANEWLANHVHSEEDIEAVHDIIRRVKAASYWEWHRGSRLFFWRFPEEWRDDARDGVEFWKLDTPPSGIFPNIPAETREAELTIRKKIFKLLFRGYQEHGFVKLVIPRFSIVKATEGNVITDIRCIWDCKANGLNAVLWAPGFRLPSAEDAKNMVVKYLDRTIAEYLEDEDPKVDYSQDESVMTKSTALDIDVGEMFYNYRTHKKDRQFLGARIISTRHSGKEPSRFVRFTALPFGARTSPFIAYQGQCRILELAEGDKDDESNPFQWDRVHMNLPCAQNFDPSLPRVFRLRKDGEMATSQNPYVDDIHAVGRDTPGQPSRTEAAGKRLKRKMNYYGNQADERKFRFHSLNPGSWRGIIISTGGPFPMISTTMKKWTRFKDGLKWIISAGRVDDYIDTAELRRLAGLGVHITEVYSDVRCYLRGFFNAIEAFRWNRDCDGWRLQDAMESAAQLEDEDASRAAAGQDYPATTKITSELLMHASALLEVFKSEEPLCLPIRPSHKGKLRYFIGDASAEGLGSGIQYPNRELRGREGLWDESFAGGGSNLREAQCQVNQLLHEIKEGLHDGCEIWAFSDNAVWSAVFTKGTSSAKHLFKLVLDLKIACYEHEVYLRTCHISGDRMIATGMDGWSRGDYNAGISLGHDLRDFLPLNVPAFDRPGQRLETWCKGWMGSQYSPPLEPAAWYWEGHRPGVHIWAPAPAAALEALKQLSNSRLKRMSAQTHVFICPRLLYQEEWRRAFEKEFDIWFTLWPVSGSESAWTNSCFEPLLIGLSFPLNRTYPWLVRQERQKVVEIGRSLSALSQLSHLQVRDYLRKLWSCPRSLPSVP